MSPSLRELGYIDIVNKKEKPRLYHQLQENLGAHPLLVKKNDLGHINESRT